MNFINSFLNKNVPSLFLSVYPDLFSPDNNVFRSVFVSSPNAVLPTSLSVDFDGVCCTEHYVNEMQLALLIKSQVVKVKGLRDYKGVELISG